MSLRSCRREIQTFTPVTSQAVNQFQKENNQYTQLVWRHDVNASNFFSLGIVLPGRLCELSDRSVERAGVCAGGGQR